MITTPSRRIREENGGGRGPRTRLALSLRVFTEEPSPSLVESIDNSIRADLDGLPSAGMVTPAFVERIELELFRDLELRLDFDPGFDFRLGEDLQRKGCTVSCGSGSSGLGGNGSSAVGGYVDNMDAHE